MQFKKERPKEKGVIGAAGRLLRFLDWLSCTKYLSGRFLLRPLALWVIWKLFIRSSGIDESRSHVVPLFFYPFYLVKSFTPIDS